MTHSKPLPIWQKLAKHQKAIANQQMRDWFATDPHRFEQYSLRAGPLFLDYSRNHLTEETLPLLCELAMACQVPQKIAALFTENCLNVTENRPALHTALRDPSTHPLEIEGHNIRAQIKAAQTQMARLVDRLHNKQWRGITGKPITQLVHLGIGGSHLGAVLCLEALQHQTLPVALPCHFLAQVDYAAIQTILTTYPAETTLFIIASKSFDTLETLLNAQIICTHLIQQLGPAAKEKHCLAITAAPEKALAFGIPQAHILPLWHWVNGRYSIWSSIGFALMQAIGEKKFNDFLTGAYTIDQHVRITPLSNNLPVILALLSIWYCNFFASPAQAIVPYGEPLRHLVPYLQQMAMESNGKSTRLDHTMTTDSTSPIIFGEEGIQGQHAYHQWLHQSHTVIPVDFIISKSPSDRTVTQQDDLLLASALSQATALMQGQDYAEAYTALVNHPILKGFHGVARRRRRGTAECTDQTMRSKRAKPSRQQSHPLKDAEYTLPHPIPLEQLAHHLVMPGNKPSNLLLLDGLNAYTLGALLALYEHKTFIQGVIWNINPFDQWGVLLGKQLLPLMLESIQARHSTDSALRGLIKEWQCRPPCVKSS